MKKIFGILIAIFSLFIACVNAFDGDIFVTTHIQPSTHYCANGGNQYTVVNSIEFDNCPAHPVDVSVIYTLTDNGRIVENTYTFSLNCNGYFIDYQCTGTSIGQHQITSTFEKISPEDNDPENDIATDSADIDYAPLSARR